ncbi:MAG: hypothetical protein LEGION0403_FIIPPAGN_00452 [Legionella sp.]|uniref:methyltransferase domain-containing protein n=1 Tax=Legionella sp. TaxID=459 RepID=UPI003D0BC0A0
MLIKQQKRYYRALNKWFQSPLGLFVAHEFSINLEATGQHLYGDTLIQLGNCGENLWLKKLDFEHQWIVSPFALSHQVHIESELNHLPLNANSIDCIVVPLSLEPFNMGSSLIDEIDRVLKPMGHVILFCINPWSLWGGAIKCGLLTCYNDHNIKMRTPFNLNRMFIQRGYMQVFLNNFCYIPPVNSATLIKKLTFLDEIGKMLWPCPSGFYCYIAQKYQVIHPSLTLRSISQPISDYQPALQPVTLTSTK